MTRRKAARIGAAASYDYLAWTVAIVLAVFERFDFRLSHIEVGDLAIAAPLAGVVALLAGGAVGLYSRKWTIGSLDEAVAVSVAVLMTTAVCFAGDVLSYQPLPRSSVIGAGFIALVVMSMGRVTIRMYKDRQLRPSDGASRMIVFGAGEGGMQSVRAMLRHPTSPYVPVAFLDDDPEKRNFRFFSIRVQGGRRDLEAVAKRTKAASLLIAVPSAGRDVFAPLTYAARDIGLEVKILPGLTDFAGVTVDVGDIRDVEEEDLLGRRAVHTDVSTIAGYLMGKRVLVTGAGGSIGAELCRQINRFGPSELIEVDRDESALHSLELSRSGRALMDSPDVVVLDIRDTEGVRELFLARRPQVVFHAAALKHLPLLERYPGEALQTNVEGTRNVLRAAAEAGVDHFVNISTDKAADPVSVLGYTKRIAERLTATSAQTCSGVWVSVRFGNVLGTRGSMLPTFRSQIELGGPLTVTDPLATRFFMTIKEAVELVVQAGAIGRSGEALVLDMGEPVCIDTVARRMAAQGNQGRPIEIIYTGLREGEKLHEVMFGVGEVDTRPFHELISHVVVPPLDVSMLEGLSPRSSRSTLIAGLMNASRDAGVRAVRSEFG